MSALPAPVLISIKTACVLTSLSRTTIWTCIRAGGFPQPVPITSGRVAFVEAEVRKWIEDRIAARKPRAA